MNKNSEFGKGLVYCLGLFLSHAERYNEKNEEIFSNNAEMWFNGASDHLYEIEIPKNINKKLRDRIRNFQDKCLEYGHGFKGNIKEKNVIWAIQEAKDLLFEIDKLLKVNPIKATWN
jgi:hypothetical protein